MPIKFRYDEDDKIIYAEGEGIVTLNDLLDYGENILQLESDLNGATEYVNFENVEDISVTYQTAKRMLSVYGKWVQRGVKGSIIYAPGTINYGMARMIGAVLSSVMNVDSGGPEIIQRPLKSEEIKKYFSNL